MTSGSALGRYQIIRPLGSGGMGEVYLANDPMLDRRVAIKLLPDRLASEPVANERLRREALAAAALDHPFICKILELARDDGHHYIVMEYVSGQSLHERLRSGPLPLDQALRIAGEIAEALEEAHAQNIVHRDLKPANIMLTAQGRVKVMDFGLAKRQPPASDRTRVDPDATVARALTGVNMVAGTPAYMSPEQVCGGDVGPQADIFALGILFCELATGSHPFERDSVSDTLAAIVRDPPRIGDLPPGLVDFVRRLLAKAPAERYAAMVTVRQDLERIGRSLGSGAFAAISEPTGSTALIGRDAEYSELLRHFQRAMEGRGLLTLIGGEPGVGKSTLIDELLREAKRRGAFCLTGHCYEMEGATPYAPFVEMLEYSARVAPPASFRQALGDSASEVARLVPELRRSYPDIPPSADLPPEQQRRFLFNAYRDFVERSARATPMVAVFEDLHWADEPTLLMLQHVVQTIGTAPALIVATYRDNELDFTGAFARSLEIFQRKNLATRIALKRLGVEGVGRMLASLSGSEPPPSVTRIIFDQTEGNPFFVGEVYRHLSEEGKTFDEHGAWRSGLNASELEVPQGVRLVISRRLERLSSDAVRVLGTAAVIGRSFDVRLLETLECANPDGVLDAIEEAERAHLVIHEPAGREVRYRFVHALIRQTLAEKLSLPRRQKLHLRISQAIERVYGPNLDPHISALAHHLYHAGAAADLEKTVDCFERAGERAVTMAAHEEALAHFDNALSLLEGESGARSAALLVRRSHVLRSLGRPRDAVQSLERAVGIFEAAGDGNAAASATFSLARLISWQMDVPAAMKVLARSMTHSDELEPAVRCRGLLEQAACQGLAGNAASAALAVAEARALAESSPDLALKVHARITEALNCICAMRFPQSEAAAREADAGARQTGNLWIQAEAGFAIGIAAARTGRPAESARLKEEVIPLCEKIGHMNIIQVCRICLCDESNYPGELSAAERAARERVPATRGLGTQVPFLAHLLLADILMFQGKIEEAIPGYRQAIEQERPAFFRGLSRSSLFLALAFEDPKKAEEMAELPFEIPTQPHAASLGSWAALLRVVLGLAQIGRDEAAAALYPLTQGLLATGTWCYLSGIVFDTAAGTAAACGGNWSRAEEHHTTAIHWADSAPYRTGQAYGRAQYAEMLLKRGGAGDLTRARVLLREAQSIYESRGMPSFARRASDRLASLP